jgi:ABC-2 type transport system permease protein
VHKILLIAKRDYVASVRTKAFVVGLIVAPLLFGGSFLGIALVKGKPDIAVRRVAVVDRTGVAASAVIQQLQEQNNHDLFDKTTGIQVMPRYEFENVTPDGRNPGSQRLALSDRVRQKTLFAFVEIGADAVQPGGKASPGSLLDGFAWYSNEGGFNNTQRWVSGPLNDGLRRVRLERLGIDSRRFHEVLNPVPVENMNLVSKDRNTGRIVEARIQGKLEGFAAPFVLVLLLVMIVLSISGPTLSAVAEDKMQRVFEMLLASTTPLHLMAGKILAATCIAFTSATFYIVTAIAVLGALSITGLAPLQLLPWFFIYLAAEVTMLSAFATALGAACSSPQDAQSLAIIVLLPVMIPLFLIVPVLQQPNGTIAQAASFFPLFTPLLMLMRQASASGVPAWQPYVGLTGVAIATVVISWISSRIFRIAILSQGKTPSLAELVRWGFRS